MEFKDIIAIRGKSDLYKIISRSTNGIIAETLNETKARFKVDAHMQVLVLQDITVFSSDNSDLYLKEVLKNVHLKQNSEAFPQFADDRAVKTYFTEIAPKHDPERVYVSDMKKILKWYKILVEFCPEIFEVIMAEEINETANEAEETETAPAEEKTE